MRLQRLTAISVVLGLAPLAHAHVGSADIYLDGKAGPYQLFVTVRPPLVIPGVAELEVRSESPSIKHLRAVAMPLTGAGAKFAPVPDKLVQSTRDAQFFTGSLWLMAPGSWQVRITATGDKGDGTVAVPVSSAALAIRKMHTLLGGFLSLLGIFIVAGLVAMAGASVREARLAPGLAVPPQNKRKAKFAMAIAVFIVAGALWVGHRWWNSEAASYSQQIYKPLVMSPALDRSGVLTLTLSDPGWFRPNRRMDYRRDLFTRTIDDLVPDHNHLMHLYAIREPGLDVVYHLHPEQTDTGIFRLTLPNMEPGDYRLYADIVHATGFPETMLAQMNIPAGLPGRALTGDDASGHFVSWTQASSAARQFKLPDGYVMHWLDDGSSLHAKVAQVYRFELTDAAGRPAQDVQLYMGMLGHAAFIKTDGTVFAHVHPSGSVSMAALEMAQHGQPAANGADMSAMDMSGMNMPGMDHSSALELLPNKVGFPYGFPTPGRYRIFVQMKHGGIIETGIFDASVY